MRQTEALNLPVLFSQPDGGCAGRAPPMCIPNRMFRDAHIKPIDFSRFSYSKHCSRFYVSGRVPVPLFAGRLPGKT
eukprot:6190743-Pleurochrysis_carterae.AAC.2